MSLHHIEQNFNATQFAIRSGANDAWYRRRLTGTWTEWVRLYTNADFSENDINNWNAIIGQYIGFEGNAGYATLFDGDLNALPVGNIVHAVSGNSTNQPSGVGTPRSSFTFGARSDTDSGLTSDLMIGTLGLTVRNRTNNIWRKVWTDSDYSNDEINNWKNAYNNYVSRTHNNPVVGGTFAGDLNSINKGTYLSYMSTTAIGKPFLQVGGLISVGSATVGSQILLGRTGNELWIRGYDGNYGEWFRVWNSGDFNAALKADLVDGKVPVSQLPSFVDDVLEYSGLAVFPSTGETGKVYIAQDTNKTYRWSGTAYVIIGTDLALGETSATAYRGDRGKTAYDHSQASGNPHNTQIEEIQGLQSSLEGKANIGNTLTYKGLISLGADFNDYKTTGIYVPQDSETCTNIPSINSGKLEVAIDQYNNAYQTYHDNSNDVHTRTYQVNEGLWSAWEKLSKTSNIIVDNSLTAQQTNASLNSVHSDKPISFILAAPNIDKGKLYIKTSQTRWLSFSGDLLLD